MKKLLKHKKLLLLGADLLLIPGLWLCRLLSTFLLAETNNPCALSYFGGKCVACGGTHFVKSLLSGNLWEAFGHNALLFILTAVLVVSWLLLHAYWLFHWNPAGFVLKKIFSPIGLYVTTGGMVVFFIIRIMPIFIRLFSLLQQNLQLLFHALL